MSRNGEIVGGAKDAQQTHHRRIALALFWVGLFVLVGKLVGAAKEMAIAWRYGVSDVVDAYVYIFNLINWPVSVCFSVLTVVLLPLIARAKTEDPDELVLFNRELFGLMLLVGCGLGLAMWLGLPLLFDAGLAGLAGRSLEAARQMLGPLCIMVPLGMLISYFSAWMMARGFHRNTLMEALPALAILVALLLPGHLLDEPLVWGSVLGFALNALALAFAIRSSGELRVPAFAFRSTAWNGFWHSLGIMALGQVLISSTAVIDQVFAAKIGQGAISSLNYANRVVTILLSLGGLAISRATLPVFSEMAAKGDEGAVRSVAFHWAKIMAGLGLAGATFAWVLAPWMVSVLFQRGAFTAQNTEQVAEVLRYYLVHVPIYFYALVLAAALSSRKLYFPLMITGVIALVLKPLSTVVLIHFMGVNGVALSTAILYIATSTYMAVYLARK
jgi:peptidoglycan biosynthesis protein MviN/MurJ (putative lipid II flippase)